MVSGHPHVFVFACICIILETAVQGDVCRDNIPDCSLYTKKDLCDSGKHGEWIEMNCRHYCGLCTRTTPCEDRLDNCQTLDSSACHVPHARWAQNNCEKTCRFCHGPTTHSTETPIARATTQVPGSMGTIVPQTAWPRPPCQDRLINCEGYGTSACQGSNMEWAMQHCARTCGLCPETTTSSTQPPTTTTQPPTTKPTEPPTITTQTPTTEPTEALTPRPPCRDNIDNCNAYNLSTACHPPYLMWAQANCLKACGFCHEPTTVKPTETPTLLPLCKDNLDNCHLYDLQTACHAPHTRWANSNCKKTCGLCDVVQPTIPPRVCKDKLASCYKYNREEVCKAPYIPWAMANCEKTCGFCHVSAQDQKEIIDLINDIRSKVQPPAKDMPKVIWDQRAADQAQENTDKCNFSKITRANIPAYGKLLKGKITMAIGETVSWTSLIKLWESPKSIFQYDKEPETYLGPDGWIKVGVYTQIVTNDVVRVGCGNSKCSNGDTRFRACVFVWGNKLRRPYESGERCGSCPNSCSNGLCDCGGLLCLNGKTLDMDACTCK